MSLVVEVKSAKDLPNVDKDGMSDPFCVITFKGFFLLLSLFLFFCVEHES